MIIASFGRALLTVSEDPQDASEVLSHAPLLSQMEHRNEASDEDATEEFGL